MGADGASSASSTLIVDDQPLRIDGLEALVRRLGVAVVARATSHEEASRLLDESRPDLVIANYDLALDGKAGEDGAATRPLALLGRARAANTAVKCIVFSDRDDPAERAGAFRSGATAFCVKHAAAADFAVAVRQAFRPVDVLRPPDPAGRAGSDPRGGPPRRPPLAAHEARNRNPPPRGRRPLEPTSREDPLGDRADSEFPPLQHLPQARRHQPHRSKHVGPPKRSPRRRGRRRPRSPPPRPNQAGSSVSPPRATSGRPAIHTRSEGRRPYVTVTAPRSTDAPTPAPEPPPSETDDVAILSLRRRTRGRTPCPCPPVAHRPVRPR